MARKKKTTIETAEDRTQEVLSSSDGVNREFETVDISAIEDANQQQRSVANEMLYGLGTGSVNSSSGDSSGGGTIADIIEKLILQHQLLVELKQEVLGLRNEMGQFSQTNVVLGSVLATELWLNLAKSYHVKNEFDNALNRTETKMKDMIETMLTYIQSITPAYVPPADSSTTPDSSGN